MTEDDKKAAFNESANFESVTMTDATAHTNSEWPNELVATPEQMDDPIKWIRENIKPEDWPEGYDADITTGGTVCYTNIIGNGYTKEQVYGKDGQQSAEWVDGLPPVGEVCVLQSLGTTTFEHEVTITYRGDGVGCYLDHSNDMEYSFSDSDIVFRPIRTAEQQAEDERDEAIEAMLDLFPWTDSPVPEYCAALYDAGYRLTGKGE